MSPNPYWTTALPPTPPPPSSKPKHGPFSPPYWPTDVLKPAASWPYPYQYPGWCNYGYYHANTNFPPPPLSTNCTWNSPYTYDFALALTNAFSPAYQQSLLSLPVPAYARLTPANAPYFNWPIYLPCSSFAVPTLGDLHKELHRPATQSELDVLPKWGRDAVCNAFWARVQRVGGSAYSEGLKRVDFLAGKATFKGVRLDGAGGWEFVVE